MTVKKKPRQQPAEPIEQIALVKRLQLQSIAFDRPPFRKLGSIDIKIASRVTLIAGRNGVGKSTILALIAGSSGLTRGVTKFKTYFGSLPNVNAEECGGQVISDSLIGFFDVDSRSKALGDKLPSFECSRMLL